MGGPCLPTFHSQQRHHLSLTTHYPSSHYPSNLSLNTSRLAALVFISLTLCLLVLVLEPAFQPVNARPTATMSGNDEEREKLRPPSSLRHEILPDSTEDETMLGQSSVQESHVDNDVLDDDVITRCGFSKNRTQSDNELLNTMFLSRPGVAAGNRSPSPSVPFLFRPPPSQKNISKAGTNDNKTQKQVRFTPAGLLTPSESSIATAGSTPQAESGVVKTRGQGPVSRAGLVLIVEPTASGQYARHHN